MFKEETMPEEIYERIGVVIAYFLFTTILFFILTITHKLPESFGYIHITLITAGITIAGLGLKRLLK